MSADNITQDRSDVNVTITDGQMAELLPGLTVQPCGKKQSKADWELAHKAAFDCFLTYGALPQLEGAAKQRIIVL